MGKKRELLPGKCMCIIELKKTGVKNSAIAKQLSISDSVVSRIIKQHAETDSLDWKPRSGRPKKVTVHTTRLWERSFHHISTASSGTISSACSICKNSSSGICSAWISQLSFTTGATDDKRSPHQTPGILQEDQGLDSWRLGKSDVEWRIEF